MTRACNWCFTLNNFTEEEYTAICGVQEDDQTRYLVVGREVGEEGTPHLQGYVQFTSRMRLRRVKDLLSPRAHLEVARGKPAANRTYCTKENNFVEFGRIQNQGQRNDLSEMKDDYAQKMSAADLFNKYGERWLRHRRSIIRHVNEVRQEGCLTLMKERFNPDDVRLKEWQVRSLELLAAQSDREVLFVVDPVGNKGKTFLSKYIRSNQDAIYMDDTVLADVMYAYKGQEVVIFDLNHSITVEGINYATIECLKNGIRFSRKYESREKSFQPARVIVFMTRMPDMEAMSADRYQIQEL